jgi:signal peptidase II
LVLTVLQQLQQRYIRRIKAFLLSPFLFCLCFLAVDQGSKHWIRGHLPYQEAVSLLPHVNLFFTYNEGMAFGFFSGVGGSARYILLFLSFVVVLFLIRFLRMRRHQGPNILSYALFALLAGALGNIIDRLVFGRVTDFIDVYMGHWHFAVFNVADALISVAFMLIVLLRWDALA